MWRGLPSIETMRPTVLALAIVIAAFVIGIDFIVTLVERRLLVWRPVAAETRT